MAGLNSDIEKFFICVGTIVLVANCAVSFGSFLSCACPSVNAALAISGPVLVPLMIFSGYFLNNATVPGKSIEFNNQPAKILSIVFIFIVS
jgi:ATP-binding cassette, subfamily G (WHITE), eye pigment precursor transporter